MRLVLLVAASLALAAAPVCAQDSAGAGGRADALERQGKSTEAIAELESAIGAIWERSPLVFRKVVLVEEPPAGFGAYRERGDNVIKGGQSIHIYAEPIGFAWRPSGAQFVADFAIDVVLRDASGKAIWQKDDFAAVQVASHTRNREFMLKTNYTLTGLPAGDFTVETRLRDKVSGKQGAFSVAIKSAP